MKKECRGVAVLQLKNESATAQHAYSDLMFYGNTAARQHFFDLII